MNLLWPYLNPEHFLFQVLIPILSILIQTLLESGICGINDSVRKNYRVQSKKKQNSADFQSTVPCRSICPRVVFTIGFYNKTYQEWWIRSLKPMSGLSGRKNSPVAKPRVGSVGQTDHEWVSRI